MDSIERGMIVSRYITGSDQEGADLERRYPEIITASVKASREAFRA